MSVFDSIKSAIQTRLDKKKEEREMIERVQKEAQTHKNLIFEEEFRKKALEVAKRQALKDAAEKSGIRKLQAINRARRLSETGSPSPGSFFDKLRTYTQKNKARTAENLKRTKELREAARKMREERLTQSNQNVMWK